jgi:hypothetical protein
MALAEELTGDDDTTILVFRRDANLPASTQQSKPIRDTVIG